MTIQEFIKELKQKYSFPGCYEKFFFSVTGAVTCFDCAVKNKNLISESMKENNICDDWNIHEIELDCNMDSEIYCDQCRRQIV